MKVVIDDLEQELHFKDFASLDQFWSINAKEIERKGKLIYSVEVNDNLFYEGYEDVIVQNFNQIHTLKLTLITVEQAYQDTYSEVCDYIGKLIGSTDKVSSPFYGNPEDKDWELLMQFTQGLYWLYQSSEFCGLLKQKWAQDINDPYEWNDMKSALTTNLNEIENLMNTQQYVQLADFIMYEITPWLEETILALKG